MKVKVVLIFFILALGEVVWNGFLPTAYAEDEDCDETVTFPTNQKELQLSENQLPFALCWKGWVCSDLELSRGLDNIKKQIDAMYAESDGGVVDKSGQPFAAIKALQELAMKISRGSELKEPRVVIDQLERKSLVKEIAVCYAKQDAKSLLQWASWYLKVAPMWNKAISRRADELTKIAYHKLEMEDACVGRVGYGFVQKGIMDKVNEMEGRKGELQEKARTLQTERTTVISDLNDVRENIRRLNVTMKKKEELEKVLENTRKQIHEWEIIRKKQQNDGGAGAEQEAELKLRMLRAKLAVGLDTMKFYSQKQRELNYYRKEEERLVKRNKEIIRELPDIAKKIYSIKQKLEPLRRQERKVCSELHKAKTELIQHRVEYEKYVGQFIDLLRRNLPDSGLEPHNLMVTVSRNAQEKIDLAGIVRDDKKTPVSGALVSVTIGGKRYSARSGKDGRYRIKLPGGVALPEMMTVSATKNGYKPGSVKVSKTFIHHGDIVLEKNEGAACGISGTWETDWGAMKMQQHGDKVVARYEHDQGRIEGRLVGHKLIGIWAEAPSYHPPTDGGRLEFVFDQNFTSFTGRWSYGDDPLDQGGGWVGKRKLRKGEQTFIDCRRGG